MMRKVAVLGAILGLISAIAGLGLAYTYDVTRELIAQQIRESQIAAAKAVLPAVRSTEDFREEAALAARVREKVPLVDKVFTGMVDGQPAGFAVQTLPRGYGGPIILMVGISLDGRVLDIRVVDHKETPGLGTGIKDEAWSGQFKGKGIRDPLKVNKDIDSLSGATISSKAVIKGVRDALEAHAAFGGAGR